MKKIISYFIILSVLCACSAQGTKPLVENFGDIRVIELYGSWEEMGRQYGEAVRNDLNDVITFIESKFNDSGNEADIRSVADSLFCRYPHRFKCFLEGVSQTSGLDAGQLVMANAVEYAESFFCTGIAAWGDYSEGGLVYGRNYDAASYREIAGNLLITVFHPADEALATAIVGYAGELYAVNAMNSKGLFLELNNGMPTAGSTILFNRLSSTASLLNIMFDADNLDYLDAFFHTHRSFASFIIGVADSNEARSYEWCSEDTKRGDISCPEGLMVMTNHYVNPEWSYPVPSDEMSWNSLTRRNNLLNLAENNKGSIDAEQMCSMISTPIQEGGCLHDLTRYQLVYEPETMRLLVRVESAPQWTSIDMRKYFNK